MEELLCPYQAFRESRELAAIHRAQHIRLSASINDLAVESLMAQCATSQRGQE